MYKRASFVGVLGCVVACRPPPPPQVIRDLSCDDREQPMPACTEAETRAAESVVDALSRPSLPGATISVRGKVVSWASCALHPLLGLAPWDPAAEAPDGSLPKPSATVRESVKPLAYSTLILGSLPESQEINPRLGPEFEELYPGLCGRFEHGYCCLKEVTDQAVIVSGFQVVPPPVPPNAELNWQWGRIGQVAGEGRPACPFIHQEWRLAVTRICRWSSAAL